jgi:gamma-glutamyltranspeptidase/glutathione hydrolase
MVATSQPLAAQAGLSVLDKGGNVVDAAVATAMALTVVEPSGCGLGSNAFAIVWDGNELHGRNASGRSPAAWNLKRFSGPCIDARTRLGHGDGTGRGIRLDRVVAAFRVTPR